jgi:hypothetical protein
MHPSGPNAERVKGWTGGAIFCQTVVVRRGKRDLYYTYPISRTAAREKRRRNLVWAVIVGVLICGLMIWIISHWD